MSKLTELCVVDIETSALNENEGCIVEIGIILLNCETLEHFNLFNHLIKEPEKTLDCDAWIFNNSDLSYDLAERLGIQLEMLRPQLQAIFDKYNCTAYNQDFDFKWLRSRGFTIKKIAPDPMYIFKDDVMHIPDGRRGFKVIDALNHYNIEENEPHRALGDATLEAKIIAAMIQQGQYPLEITDNHAEILKWRAKQAFHEYWITQIANFDAGYLPIVDVNTEDQLIWTTAMHESAEHFLADQQKALKHCVEDHLAKLQ
jgi:DNA polymerase III epsilon subunit-like protein